MPTLKQLTCHVERGPTDSPLHEYATEYGDGVVTTYLAVPNKPTPFKIHLISHGFIAHGLAMFVFIDGKPQCNRNRRGLEIPASGSDHSKAEIDFQVHQREVRSSNGRWVARPFRFEKLNTVEADSTPEVTEHVKWNTGTIEVIILRCEGEKSRVSTTDLAERRKPVPLPTKSAMSQPKPVNALGFQPKLQPLPERRKNTVKFNLKPDPPARLKPTIPTPARAPRVVVPDPPPQPSLQANRKSRRLPKINLWGSLFDGSADEPREHLPRYSTNAQQHTAATTRHYEDPGLEEGFSLGMFDQLDGTSDAGPAGIVINQFMPGEDGQSGGSSTRRRNREYPSYPSQESHWHHLHAQPAPMPAYPPMPSYPTSAYPPMPTPYGYSPASYQVPLQIQHVQPYYPSTLGMGANYNYPGAYAHHQSPPIEQGSRQVSGQTRSSSNKNNASRNDKSGSQTPNRKSSGGQRKEKSHDNDSWNNDNNNGNDNENWDSNDNNNDNKANADQGWNNDNKSDADADWGNDDNNGKDGAAAGGGWGDDNADQNDAKQSANNDSWGNAANDATKDDNWGNATNSTPKDNGWDTTPAPNQAADAWDAPAAPAANSSANTSKSRITSAPAPTTTAAPLALAYPPVDAKRPHIKAYWNEFQPHNTTSQIPLTRIQRRNSAIERATTHIEQPIAPLPAAAATQAQLSHALQPGPGATYTHPTLQPRYIDCMDKPYAVFCFKYRSGERLQEILGEELAEKENIIERGRYKDRMMALSKEEVLEELLRAKKALQYSSDSSIDDDEGFDDGDGGTDDAKSVKSAKSIKSVVSEAKSGKVETISKVEKKESEAPSAGKKDEWGGSGDIAAPKKGW